MSTSPSPIRVLTPEEAHVLLRILKAPPQKPLGLKKIRKLAAPTPVDGAFDFLFSSNLVGVSVNRRTGRPERDTYIPTANAAPTLFEQYQDISHEITARVAMSRVKPERDRLVTIGNELMEWYRKSTPQSTVDLTKIKPAYQAGNPPPPPSRAKPRLTPRTRVKPRRDANPSTWPAGTHRRMV